MTYLSMAILAFLSTLAAADQQNASALLKWQAVTTATGYTVNIARQPDGSDIFHTSKTKDTQYTTPELQPGAYYYSVESYNEARTLEQTPWQPFVIGKGLQVIGKKPLPAPTITSPKHMELFPIFGRVRVAWKSVGGAKAYRFRLWNEDRVKENRRRNLETPPRWITEVTHPWIDMHDAPHTSFMYLESATYRWDVAAIDTKDSALGKPAVGYFKTSRQWFLKEAEIFLRAAYGFSHAANYYQDSSITGKQTRFKSSAHRLLTDIDWWFIRQWGANIGGGFQTLNPSSTIMYSNVNADLLFRTYLSTTPWGWWLTLSAGFGMQEFPQVDSLTATSVEVSRPKALGARLGVRVTKRWDNPWEVELRLRTLIHAFTMGTPTGGATSTGIPFDGEGSLKLVYNWTTHFATELGMSGLYQRSSYLPADRSTLSNVAISSINAILGVRFNYFPAEAGIRP